MKFNQERYDAIIRHFQSSGMPDHIALPAARVIALDEPGVDRTQEQQAKVTAAWAYLNSKDRVTHQ